MVEFTSALIRKTLVIILAGGQGERLYPLTKDRSKPSVPFGGKYRIIDFTLSNCINSGLKKIFLITQYKSQSLDTHIRLGWSFLHSESGEFVYCMPPQFRTANHWYQGTADAVFQNLHILDDEDSEYVVILSGDHIYKMDYLAMLTYHVQRKADLTIAGITLPKDEASRFGVMVVNEDNKIIEFQEKPQSPKSLPNDSENCYVNMGIYIFKADALAKVLTEDAGDQGSAHDFGKNIIPKMLDSFDVHAYNFIDLNEAQTPYWRDIGTLDSYYDSSMDLIAVTPAFNMYDRNWPIRTYQMQMPPAKTVWDESQEEDRVGMAQNSMVSGGVIISGGRVFRSILSPGVRVNSFTLIEDSIILNNVNIGRHAKIRRAIIDKNVIVPEEYEIGYDAKEDRRKFIVSDSGIVVVPKGAVLV